MANLARVADIRGLVSLNDGEEILKERDPISDNGGLLSIREFARIIFDDGREITIDGPAQIRLDENFFQTGEYEIQDAQIQNTELAQNIAEVAENYGNGLNQSNVNADVLTEQLDASLINSSPVISTANQNTLSDEIATTNIQDENTPTNISEDTATNIPEDTTTQPEDTTAPEDTTEPTPEPETTIDTPESTVEIGRAHV